MVVKYGRKRTGKKTIKDFYLKQYENKVYFQGRLAMIGRLALCPYKLLIYPHSITLAYGIC